MRGSGVQCSRVRRAARAFWYFALEVRDWLRDEAGVWQVTLGSRDGPKPSTTAPGAPVTLSLAFAGRRFLIDDVATALNLAIARVDGPGVGSRARRARSRSAAPGTDLLVRELRPWWRVAARGEYVFQTHVDELVALEPTMEAWTDKVLGRDMRRKLKRAEQRGLRVRIGSADDLERFRETLLVPFTRHFHGERSHLPALQTLRTLLARGALLFARDATGRELGAILVINSGDEGPRFLRTGLALDVLSQPKARDDVTACLYAAFVQWAIERGASRASYGLSPAAACDGLVYFKSRWGAEPCALRRGPWLALNVRTLAADAWLRARGLYVQPAGQLVPYGEALGAAVVARTAAPEFLRGERRFSSTSNERTAPQSHREHRERRRMYAVPGGREREAPALDQPDSRRPGSGGAAPRTSMSAHGGAPVALLTHGDHYGSLAAARCLGAAGVRVVFAEHRALAPARWSRFVAERVTAPPVHELTAFGDWLVRFGDRRPGAFLCPTSDDLCWILAARHAELAPSWRLPACVPSAARELLDKQRLAEHAQRAGLRTPRTWFLDGAERPGDLAGLRFPVLLKPRTQMGFVTKGKGALVRDAAQLSGALAAYRASQHYRDEVLAWDPGLAWPMVQEYHASAVSGILSVAGHVGADDATTLMLASVKVFQWPRRLGVGVGFEERPLPDDVAQGLLRLCRSAGYTGVFEAEFLVDASDGAHLLIDFNPRFYGQMGFEIARGARLPLITLREAFGERRAVVELVRDARERTAVQPEPVRARYALSWILRLLLATQRLGGRMTRREAAGWRAWIGAATGRRTDALFGWDDALPACLDVATHVGRFARHPRDFVRKFFLDA